MYTLSRLQFCWHISQIQNLDIHLLINGVALPLKQGGNAHNKMFWALWLFLQGKTALKCIAEALVYLNCTAFVIFNDLFAKAQTLK